MEVINEFMITFLPSLSTLFSYIMLKYCRDTGRDNPPILASVPGLDHDSCCQCLAWSAAETRFKHHICSLLQYIKVRRASKKFQCCENHTFRPIYSVFPSHKNQSVLIFFSYERILESSDSIKLRLVYSSISYYPTKAIFNLMPKYVGDKIFLHFYPFLIS